METWELTEYEQQRQRHEVTMDTDFNLNPKSFTREIVCPICLDTIKEARAAPDCLHRFCRGCVDKAAGRDCPVCQKKLPSQVKSFRDDPRYDRLIAMILRGNQPATSKHSSQAPECEIILKQIEGEQTRYIKGPGNTTIDHLTRYLAIRPEGSKVLNLENKTEHKLFILADSEKGRYEMLDGLLTLDGIRETYHVDSRKPLELYFYDPREH